MGAVQSVLFPTYRARQVKVVLELFLLWYIIYWYQQRQRHRQALFDAAVQKHKQEQNESQTRKNTMSIRSAASTPSFASLVTTKPVNIHVDRTNNTSKAKLDNEFHNTNNNINQNAKIEKKSNEPTFYSNLIQLFSNIPRKTFQKLNRIFTSYSPWQTAIATFAFLHLQSNLSLLLGLSSQYTSLFAEPDMHYKESFMRVRRLLTGLDAGLLSTLHVQPKFLRDILTIFLWFYYLTFTHQAELKVLQLRHGITPQQLRACWEKGQHPVLHLADKLLRRKRCVVECQTIFIKRLQRLQEPPFQHPPHLPNGTDHDRVECALFYDKPIEQIKNETKLLIHFHGGGFVAMSPLHHADYLSSWALHLQIPIICVNYRKAPEHPYPAAVHDAFDVYAAVVRTQGQCLGMNMMPKSEAPLKIAFSGDSAGGNLAAVTSLRAIAYNLPTPSAVHLIYPSLDMAGEVWKPESNAAIPQESVEAPITAAPLPNPTLPATSLTTTDKSDPTLNPTSPTPHHTLEVAANDAVVAITRHTPTGGVATALSETATGTRAPMLASRAKYAYDAVLPIKYMLMLGEAYLRNGGNPLTDYNISPARAPSQMLAKFPSTYIHVGGVDPLVDESLHFCEKLRQSNPNNKIKIHIFSGISHAYMQVTNFLPEGKEAALLSLKWFREIFSDEETAPIVSEPVLHSQPSEKTVDVIHSKL